MRGTDWRRLSVLVVLCVVASVAVAACEVPVVETGTDVVQTATPETDDTSEQDAEKGEGDVGFTLTSSAFAQGEAIPQRYTCDGEDISPPLSWSDPPEGTVTYALIMDDPDAPSGTWVHWLFYNLPGEARGLHAGVEPQERELEGIPHGVNSWDAKGYGGPCPPGGTHRYFFRLYALDTKLELSGAATAEELRAAMEGHILATAELMGTYSR